MSNEKPPVLKKHLLSDPTMAIKNRFYTIIHIYHYTYLQDHPSRYHISIKYNITYAKTICKCELQIFSLTVLISVSIFSIFLIALWM